VSFAVTDFGQYAALRSGAARHDPATLRAVAGQFEALFIESVLKQARDASLGDPLFGESEGFEMYREMLDRQLAVEMARGRGIGLADVIVRQLGGDPGVPAPAATPVRFARPAVAAVPRVAAPAPRPDWSSPMKFARDVWPHVRRAAERLGVAPEAILAQAALETGWGRGVPARADGASSLNVFGIKAGPGWKGSSAVKPTLEYVDGIARRERARFRAYPDLSAAFDDYVRLLSGHPRYAGALNSTDPQAFGRALQEAGYATDPAYADKIAGVLASDTLAEALDALKVSGPRPTSALR
jgi:flagellar protein FlgJ